jgi:hypothetical protein
VATVTIPDDAADPALPPITLDVAPPETIEAGDITLRRWRADLAEELQAAV